MAAAVTAADKDYLYSTHVRGLYIYVCVCVSSVVFYILEEKKWVTRSLFVF